MAPGIFYAVDSTCVIVIIIYTTPFIACRATVRCGLRAKSNYRASPRDDSRPIISEGQGDGCSREKPANIRFSKREGFGRRRWAR